MYFDPHGLEGILPRRLYWKWEEDCHIGGNPAASDDGRDRKADCANGDSVLRGKTGGRRGGKG